MSARERQAIVPITLREPPRGSYYAPEFVELAGIDRVRAVKERRAPDSPVIRLTGMRFTDAGLGSVTVVMPASPWWQAGPGVFTAGALAFLADAPLGGAVLTSAPSGVIMSTSELALDFLRPANIRSQTIIGRGRLIHATRSLGLSEVFIEDGLGRLLAHGTSRCVLTPIDVEAMKARPRVTFAEETQSDLPDPYLRPVEGELLGQEFWDSTPGIEVAQMAVRGERIPPHRILMGIRTVAVEEGSAIQAMAASRWLTNGGGVIYGGALAYFADSATSMAVATTTPAATAFAPLDLKVNFLRPALPSDGELRATATIIHRGKTMAVVTVEITGPDGKVIAVANESVLILPGRPWDRAVNVAEEMRDL